MSAFSQSNKITLSSERNSDNSLSIFATSEIYGEYTVKLNFSAFAGYTSTTTLFKNNALSVVERGKKLVMKLSPDKNSNTSSLQYTYTYLPGRSLRRFPDSSFSYLLPATSGNQLKVAGFGSLAKMLGQDDVEHMLGYTFYYKANDTICATRGGIVYECTDEVKEGEGSTVAFRRSRNAIAIQHKDGTAGHYSMLSPIRLLVKAGDNVVPGQPLAVFNKESERYTLLFYSCFLDEKKFLIERSTSLQNQPSSFSYMPLHFYTDSKEVVSLEPNKSYTVQYSKEIIAAEMSKKDKKKMGIE